MSEDIAQVFLHQCWEWPYGGACVVHQLGATTLRTSWPPLFRPLPLPDDLNPTARTALSEVDLPKCLRSPGTRVEENGFHPCSAQGWTWLLHTHASSSVLDGRYDVTRTGTKSAKSVMANDTDDSNGDGATTPCARPLRRRVCGAPGRR